MNSRQNATLTKDFPAISHVAIVAREPHTRRSLTAIVQSWNISVTAFQDEFALYNDLEDSAETSPDCVVIDSHMLQHTFAEIDRNIGARDNNRKRGIVMLTSTIVGLPKGKHAVSLAKPYQPAELFAAMRTAVTH